MVQPLKFGNWYVISSHTFLCMWLLIHVGEDRKVDGIMTTHKFLVLYT